MDTAESTSSSPRPAGGAWGDLNVGRPERIASVVTGAMVAIFGMRRGGFAGALLTLTGGGLLMRGVTGFCPAYGFLGMNTAEPAGGPDADTYGYGQRGDATPGAAEGQRVTDPGGRPFELSDDEGGIRGPGPERRGSDQPL